MMNLFQHNHDYSTNASESFCDASMKMAMYMDGIKSTFLQSDGTTHCLNLLFSNCTLDTRLKFLLGMVCVFNLGIALEYLSLFRIKYIVKLERNRRDGTTTSRAQVQFLTYLQGLQVLIGYILMLVVMTYSVELILATVGGIMMGFYMFYKQKAILRSSQHRRMDESEFEHQETVGSSTPCCEDYHESEHLLLSTSSSNASSHFDYNRLTADDPSVNT